MSPRFVFDNVLNSAAANLVFFRQLSLRYAARSILSTNVNNDSICQFRQSAFLAMGMTFFGATVGAVIGVGSQEEMAWADARGIVANMEDVHSSGNVVEVQFPRVPIGSNVATVILQLPVSVLGFRAGPQPATLGFFNPLPKPFHQWPAATRHEVPVSADDAAAEPAAFADIGWVNRKRGSAHHAGAINHGGIVL